MGHWKVSNIIVFCIFFSAHEIIGKNEITHKKTDKIKWGDYGIDSMHIQELFELNLYRISNNTKYCYITHWGFRCCLPQTVCTGDIDFNNYSGTSHKKTRLIVSSDFVWFSRILFAFVLYIDTKWIMLKLKLWKFFLLVSLICLITSTWLKLARIETENGNRPKLLIAAVVSCWISVACHYIASSKANNITQNSFSRYFDMVIGTPQACA